MNEITTSSLLPIVRNSSVILGKTFIGIDFGTTTTVVSIASYDVANNLIHAESLSLKQKLVDGVTRSDLVPTVIAWYNNGIFVGEGASDLKYKLKRGKNIWYSFKMELGEDLGAKYFESELKETKPFYIVNPKDATRVFFSYLKYLILEYCKEHHLSNDIFYSVSIPASFEANQRRDLMDALSANGMTVSKQALIDEPNAAFISYVVSCASEGHPLYLNPDYNSKVLVFDFGGGTCDISMLEIGQNSNGFFSKNISISKYTKLGGDDIDRYITYHYLLPRFLEANNKEDNLFRTNEKKIIACALYKVAERLKIMKCKTLSNMMSDYQLPQVALSDIKTEIITPVTVMTSKGVLKQDNFYLTNKELTDTMAVFLKKGRFKRTIVQGEDEYESIFSPIQNAIKKSNIRKEEIDYVLLIGGSSQSPYIQCALKEYFEDSEMLVPMNLRTQVSQGAAIHSLIYNGMNKCIIQPITSEPLVIITKDEQIKTILPAGTEIPCNTILIEDLVTSRPGQKVVELPICVGNSSKLLFNLKIESSHVEGFPINTPIELVLEVNADKMLQTHASCMGVHCEVEPLNPFANKELSTEERIALKAERQYNLNAIKNGGTPSLSSINDLISAYEKAGQSFKAAEAADLKKEIYPQSISYNSIGVYYSNAGAKAKAISFYERALDENPNNKYANSNLGSDLRTIDPNRAKVYLERALEIDSSYEIPLIELGRIASAEGNLDEANKYFQKAFDIYMIKWKAGELNSVDKGWFVSVARELGKSDIVNEIRSQKNEVKDEYYDKENLAKLKNTFLTSNF